jgi:hypothetical protein
MKLIVNAAYAHLKPSLSKLPELFRLQGKTIYKSRNELKVLDIQDMSLNVKQYRIPIFVNRVIYTFFRRSKASRAYEYAMILREKGFDSPEPIAYLELKSKGLLSGSYFVSRQLSDFRMMREFADGSSIAGREDIIEALGVYVARLHQAGILHLDLSVGNILFKKDEKDIHFWLVDLNRMRFCPIGLEKGCKNFERLRGCDAFFEVLARSYAMERGFNSVECLEKIRYYQKRSVLAFRAKMERKEKNHPIFSMPFKQK